MRRVFSIVILVILFLSAQSVLADALNMERLTAEDGLFSNRIFKTYKSPSGYLWVAGINGVSRYDGYHFQNFTPNDEDDQVVGERFYDITEDVRGQVWLGGGSGLFKYDWQKQIFIPKERGLITQVRHLSMIDDSLMFVSSSSGQNFIYNCETETSRLLPFLGLISASLKTISGDVLRTSKSGAIILNDRDTLFTLNKTINDICQTPDGDIWLAVIGGVYRIPFTASSSHYRHAEKVKLSLSHNNVTSVAYTQGHLWVGTRKGLDRVSLSQDGSALTVDAFFNLPDQSTSLSNNDITDLYVDNEDVLWVSTYGGLNKIDATHQYFLNYRNDPNNPGSLHTNNIFPISGDSSGYIWFGSIHDGLAMLDTKEDRFTYFDHYKEKGLTLVKSIYTDRQDRVWVAADQSLYLAKPSGLQSVDIINRQGKKYKYRQITDLVQHPNGNFYVSVDGRIIDVEQISDLQFQIVNVYKRKGIQAIRFYTDTMGRLWLTTRNIGLVLLDHPFQGEIAVFSKKNQPAFKTNEIQAIEQDQDGNLWLGSVNGMYCTPNDSVFQSSPDSIQFQGFFVEDGLPHNYISNILPSNDGSLWLSSWRGLIHFNPSAVGLSRYVPYTFSDGLVDDKYNRTAAYWDQRENTYYFGSVNGVNYFSPVAKESRDSQPKVLIHSVSIDDEVVSLAMDARAETCQPVTIRGSISHLRVAFSSSSLRSPDKQVFAYQLLGNEQELTHTRERELVFDDLKHGKYALSICCVADNGQLCKPVTIPLVIKFWGIKDILILILSLAIIATVIVMRKRRVKKKIKAKADKYAFSTLTEDKSELAQVRLSELMLKDKPYLQSDLTAEALAKMIGISQGELSQMLTEYMDSHFYEFINKYRVEEFIRIQKTEDAHKLTIVALSEQCGFSSKSTFYRAFKHEKGMTPAQYIKSIKS